MHPLESLSYMDEHFERGGKVWPPPTRPFIELLTCTKIARLHPGLPMSHTHPCTQVFCPSILGGTSIYGATDVPAYSCLLQCNDDKPASGLVPDKALGRMTQRMRVLVAHLFLQSQRAEPQHHGNPSHVHHGSRIKRPRWVQCSSARGHDRWPSLWQTQCRRCKI
jgi:hypothetical protein